MVLVVAGSSPVGHPILQQSDLQQQQPVFNRSQPSYKRVIEGEVLRFRFSPPDAKVWAYEIQNDFVARMDRCKSSLPVIGYGGIVIIPQ